MGSPQCAGYVGSVSGATGAMAPSALGCTGRSDGSAGRSVRASSRVNRLKLPGHTNDGAGTYSPEPGSVAFPRRTAAAWCWPVSASCCNLMAADLVASGAADGSASTSSTTKSMVRRDDDAPRASGVASSGCKSGTALNWNGCARRFTVVSCGTNVRCGFCSNNMSREAHRGWWGDRVTG